MHHACIDGGAGAALTSMIYDVADPREGRGRLRHARWRRSRATSPPI
jgi:hypothetical protein